MSLVIILHRFHKTPLDSQNVRRNYSIFIRQDSCYNLRKITQKGIAMYPTIDEIRAIPNLRDYKRVSVACMVARLDIWILAGIWIVALLFALCIKRVMN